MIKQPYQIAKYPVTNLQYRRFMEAKGYETRAFWSDDGWHWRTGTYDSEATETYEARDLHQRPTEKRGEPFYWNDVKWNNPLAPVVGVCWFEAEAYCNWLSHENWASRFVCRPKKNGNAPRATPMAASIRGARSSIGTGSTAPSSGWER